MNPRADAIDPETTTASMPGGSQGSGEFAAWSRHWQRCNGGAPDREIRGHLHFTARSFGLGRMTVAGHDRHCRLHIRSSGMDRSHTVRIESEDTLGHANAGSKAPEM